MTITDDDFVLLSAYGDGELSPGEALDMERRLAADPALRATAERLGVLSNALKEALVVPPASPALRARIVQKLGFNDAAPRSGLPQSWRSLAAVLLIGLFGGGAIGSVGTYLGLASASDATVDAVLAGHLRGLIAPQPFDVASSNRHVVKPWFNGRTTIAPQVPDFASQGFPLVGGRIDVVGGKAVPTLVYRHDKHVISVTVVPATASATAGDERRAGSTIERWAAGDLAYLAVSDLQAGELRHFTELFRAQTAGEP